MYILSPPFRSQSVPPAIVNHFVNSPIRSPFSGFTTGARTFQIGSIVGQYEVDEDMVDFQLELLYLRTALQGTLKHFILPMPFAPALLQAYRTFPHYFPPHLSALRTAIHSAVQASTFGSISFIECAGFHFTPYHFARSGRFSWGNSLPGPPPHLADLRDAFEWFLSDLPLPKPNPCVDMAMPLQAVGSRDCALFAYAGLMSQITPGFGWMWFDVEELRARWAADILKHHYRACQYQVSWILRSLSSFLI